MSTDSNHVSDFELGRLLDRLIKDFGFANSHSALTAALAYLIEELEARNAPEEDDWPAIELAVDEYLQGAVGIPIDDAFAERRKRHNLPEHPCQGPQIATDPPCTSIPESPEIAGMLNRLVTEFGYHSPEAASKDAPTILVEDLEYSEVDEEELLREALEDIERGERGRPADEIFEEIRREFKIQGEQ